MYKNVGLDDLRFCINEIRNCTLLQDLDVTSQIEEIGAAIKSAYTGCLAQLSGIGSVADIRDNLDDLKFQWVVANLFRKFRYAPSEYSEKRQAEALTGFGCRNLECKGHRVPPNVRYVMRNCLSRWLPKPTPRPDRFAIGPGAVCDVPRATHFDKFLQLTKHGALRQPFTGGSGFANPWACGGLDTAPCRLCAVPKDFYRDRLITVEPVLLAFGQQEARHVIYNSIAEGPLGKRPINHLRFRDPTAFFRAKAVEGSRDGTWATIDLSNASDLIAWDDVRDVFPSWMVAMLECVRSEQYTDGSKERTVHMYAGMGNATTFVVESLFFRALMYALSLVNNSPFVVETFGDDIILGGYRCTDDIDNVLLAAADCGLVVNVDKSYYKHTYFRESCGEICLGGYSFPTYRFYGYGRGEYSSLCDLLSRMGGDPTPSVRKLAQEILDSRIGDILISAGCHEAPGDLYRMDGTLTVRLGSLCGRPDLSLPERRWNPGFQCFEYCVTVETPRASHRSYNRTDYPQELFDAACFWSHLYGVALPSFGDGQTRITDKPRGSRVRRRWLR